jgi:hypothetical protein
MERTRRDYEDPNKYMTTLALVRMVAAATNAVMNPPGVKM